MPDMVQAFLARAGWALRACGGTAAACFCNCDSRAFSRDNVHVGLCYESGSSCRLCTRVHIFLVPGGSGVCDTLPKRCQLGVMYGLGFAWNARCAT